jgi:hypothetical protein
MSDLNEPGNSDPKTNHTRQQSDTQTYTLNEAHRHFAIQANGRVWQLLEQQNRGQPEDDELLYAVYASAHHWLQVGTRVHQQRGEYLISKVHLSLDQPQQALRHARRCMALTELHQEQMADFDLAYAHEGLARACAAAGHQELALEHRQLARQLGDEIQDSEDKEIFDADIEGGNWYGIV